MLKLEEKDYDLNFLFKFSFDFEMLKEILFKLVKTNKDLQSKVNILEKKDKEKEKRISNLEDKLNIVYIPDEKDKIISSETDENDIYKDTRKDKEDIKEKEEKIDEKENEEFNKRKIIKERSKTIKNSSKFLDDLKSYISPISPDTIKSLLKMIKDNTETIKNVEKLLNRKITDTSNDLEKQIKDLDFQNNKQHKVINSKITDLYNRINDFGDKMDGVIVKTAALDPLTIIKDSGDGTVDTTKLMIKILEEKINKKIELIEKRTQSGKRLGDNTALGLDMDNIGSIIDQLKKDIESLKENGGSDYYNDAIRELKDLIEKKNHDLLIIIEELSKKMKEGEFGGDKMDDILKNINNEKEINKKKQKGKDKKNENIIRKMEEKENAEMNEKISDLKERLKDLNKKINDIDNYFKNLLNNQGQDIGVIKRRLEEIDEILEKKISKDDLKELYTTTSEHTDQLKYLTDKVQELNEGFQKFKDNNPSLVKRIETLGHEILELKERDVKEVQYKPLDLTKYIDENKLKEALKTYKKNIDILLSEKDSMENQIKEIQDLIKFLETKERVNKTEEEINEKMNDLANKLTKKYADRVEIGKLFKSFEAQMKLLMDSNKTRESDNWILAKQPFTCFNCATCEANIKNLSPSNEYLPWNKYPAGERQYNVGQGFSKLLQRISNDSAFKNYNNDKKDFSSDYDINNNNLYNSMSNIKSNNNFVFRINNRENMRDDFNNIYRFNKNYKLPKVINNRRKNNHNIDSLPYTDEENEKYEKDKNRSYDSSSSPKIMRITKKKINDFSNQLITNSQVKSVNVDTNIKNNNSTINKTRSKLERVKSMPFYDNV